MKEFNIETFRDWLTAQAEEKEEKAEGNDKLLIESKLSKYWKVRAARRAKGAGRNWPNKHDRDWALKEQEKSQSINSTIHSLFEKELEDSEEMTDDISGMLEKIKKARSDMKLRREAKWEKPTKKIKKKKSLSKPPPPHKKGEGVAGYYKKASKKYGGATAAPGETIGPLEEKKE